jgi:hypothetical protein
MSNHAKDPDYIMNSGSFADVPRWMLDRVPGTPQREAAQAMNIEGIAEEIGEDARGAWSDVSSGSIADGEWWEGLERPEEVQGASDVWEARETSDADEIVSIAEDGDSGSDEEGDSGTGTPPAIPGEPEHIWVVPPGGIITTGAGYLRRERPDTFHHRWSEVAVGRKPAYMLSVGLGDRDLNIMSTAEQLRVVTLEQITRAYFDRNITARKRLRLLRQRRYLASPEVDHQVVSAAVGRRPNVNNAPFILDWNGKYLLEQEGYTLCTWNPATVAQVNGRFAHIVCVSEIWSYIMAMARASYEMEVEYLNGQDHIDESAVGKHKFDVGLYNESESAVYSQAYTGWSLNLEASAAKVPKRNYRVVVRPDATFVLGFRPVGAGGYPSDPGYSWSWSQALPPLVPSYEAAEDEAGVKYRQLFLEMETGSNSSNDVIKKIDRYNDLLNRYSWEFSGIRHRWVSLFGGGFPTILICVRDNAQIKGQVRLWLDHYKHRDQGAVLLVSLEMLAQAYSEGRRSLLTQLCWFDVMDRKHPGWKTLGEAVGITI